MHDVTLSPIAVDEIDRLRDLWLALHHQHRAVSPVPLVADDEASWAARRRLYLEWIGAGRRSGCSQNATGSPSATPCAACSTVPTTRSRSSYGDLYSLCVAEEVRGHGIGTRLLDEVDLELERRGVHDLRISVLAGNERAQRLYERRGLRVAELVLFRFGRS